VTVTELELLAEAEAELDEVGLHRIGNLQRLDPLRGAVADPYAE
jgi:hypothetical protein